MNSHTHHAPNFVRLETHPVTDRLIDFIATHLHLPAEPLPWYVVAPQLAGAAVAAWWTTLPVGWQVFGSAVAADFVIGSYAAFRRGLFTPRQAAHGLARKAAITFLCACVHHATAALHWPEPIGNFFLYSFASVDYASALRNCRRARIKLPPGMERLAARIEQLLATELDRRLGGVEKHDR